MVWGSEGLCVPLAFSAVCFAGIVCCHLKLLFIDLRSQYYMKLKQVCRFLKQLMLHAQRDHLALGGGKESRNGSCEAEDC